MFLLYNNQLYRQYEMPNIKQYKDSLNGKLSYTVDNIRRKKYLETSDIATLFRV